MPDREERAGKEPDSVRGRILIADDEETFLYSTADLLRDKGYECACAASGQEGLDHLRVDAPYDLLISDIRMPGNARLEFIRAVAEMGVQMPVILVTAYPSLDSAVESIQLPVVAYMTKPIDFEALLEQVAASIQQYQVYSAVRSLRARLDGWNKNLANLETSLGKPRLSKDGQPGTAPAVSQQSIAAFIDLTCENMFNSVQDVRNLTVGAVGHEEERKPCHLLNCPDLAALRGAVQDAINVLEETRNAFKSRKLGDLRQRLETVLKKMPEG